QRIDTARAHPRAVGARGSRLAELAGSVRSSNARLGGRIDGTAALQRTQPPLPAPPRDDRDGRVHRDLLPGTMSLRRGRSAATIDFGGLNVGDPACDLQPAWHSFTGISRQRFRKELGVDDATWLRGRGWALLQAVIALPYYWDTNPGIVRQSLRALDQVLADVA